MAESMSNAELDVSDDNVDDISDSELETTEDDTTLFSDTSGQAVSSSESALSSAVSLLSRLRSPTPSDLS